MIPEANISAVLSILHGFITQLKAHPGEFLSRFFLFVLIIEMPVYFVIILGNIISFWRRLTGKTVWHGYTPKVSCIVTCYSEGEAVRLTMLTLFEQLYEGTIEVIAVVDGSIQNKETLNAVKDFASKEAHRYQNRILRILPKPQRGGRVSSLNSGLLYSTGEIVMALDGDTSFDNDMVRMVTRHFVDPRVCAVSGALVARNAKASLVTRLQSLEYTISLIFCKTGLSVFNIVNNVSGAFGVFRRTMLKQVGGWSNGTAEDLDMTLRIKQYIRRTGFIIRFEPFAIGKTDVPDKWHIFLLQRLRWDGDLGYLYMRKHVMAFQPRLIGWPNYIILIWNGLLMQIALPFVIFIYTVSLVFILPLADWVALNLFILFYYSGVTVVMFACHMIMTSRNRYEDMRLAVLLPIFCLYAYVNRLWSCVALLNEGLRRGHEESSMAPWWVLRRKKF